jgi:hypothetical protein
MPVAQFICTHAAQLDPAASDSANAARLASMKQFASPSPLAAASGLASGLLDPDGPEELLLQPAATPPAATAAIAEIEINQRVTRMIFQFSDGGGQ